MCISHRVLDIDISTSRHSDNSVPGNIDDAGLLVSGEEYVVGGPCGGSNNVAADSADFYAHRSTEDVVEPMDGSLSAWAVLSTSTDGDGHALQGRSDNDAWVGKVID